MIMDRRILWIGFFLCLTAFAADKPAPVVRGENTLFAVEAKLFKDRDEVQKLLGEDIEKGIIALEITITPKGTEPMKLWREDFIVRSDKDGQKSEPYDPGQIASGSVLTLVYTSEGGGAHAQESGPVWGGVPGTQPMRLPGDGGGFGNAASVERISGSNSTEAKDDSTNELLKQLRETQLKEGEISGPETGLLFYPLEGKHKDRQIWLHYTGEGGKIDLQFRQPK
jgi:hypothetical protein